MKPCQQCGRFTSNQNQFCDPCLRLPKIDNQQAFWHKDEDYKNCESCNAAFGVFTRHHHCRHCGRNICDKCSKHAFGIGAYASRQKVCNNCHENLTGHRDAFIQQQAAITITKFIRSARLPIPESSRQPQYGIDSDLAAALQASMQDDREVGMATRRKMRVWSNFCHPGCVQQYNHNCAYNTLRMLCEYNRIEFRCVDLVTSNQGTQMLTLSEVMKSVLHAAKLTTTRNNLERLFDNSIYINSKDMLSHIKQSAKKICEEIGVCYNHIPGVSVIINTNDHFKFIFFDLISQSYLIRDAALGETKESQCKIFLTPSNEGFKSLSEILIHLVIYCEANDITIFNKPHPGLDYSRLIEGLDNRFALIEGYIPGVYLCKGNQ
tara:strand:- start:3781 stop:4914 length:1134 start_codon:yes stop_codon:yes gene_type:complete